MTLHWADLAVMAAMVIAGCVVSSFFLLRRLRQTAHESQREMERRLAALTEGISIRESVSGDPVEATDALAVTEMETEPGIDASRTESLPAETQAQPNAKEEEEISAVIQAAIAAAAIAMLGNNARVRSVRRILSSNVVSPWTQQGRVAVQSSHNLRTRT